MGKFGRKLGRRVVQRQAKELQNGSQAVRRLLGGAEGIKSLSEAITVLNDLAPIVEECRNAAFLAVQHSIALERELAKERFVRQTIMTTIEARLEMPYGARPLAAIEEEAAALWDNKNPPPAMIDPGETPELGVGEHAPALGGS